MEAILGHAVREVTSHRNDLLLEEATMRSSAWAYAPVVRPAMPAHACCLHGFPRIQAANEHYFDLTSMGAAPSLGALMLWKG